MGQNYSTINDLLQLTISGMNNNIIINHRVKTLQINGNNNRVNGLNPNCLVDKLYVSGINNLVDLNQNCFNANKNISGIGNNLQFNGIQYNSQNNIYNNNPNMNQGFYRYQYNNGNSQQNFVFNNNNLNNIMNNLNNMNINANQNNQNVNNNDNGDNNEENNNNNLSDFEKKKHDLFLEMDEYQYKHIERYGESRKETECAICLENFKGIDIIKSFYKCGHIFHKKCLEDWLKRSNCCPLCKHDLTEDINQAH